MWREQRGLVLIEVILYSFVILSILDRIAFVNLFCYDFISEVSQKKNKNFLSGTEKRLTKPLGQW